jgi:hypothetical protein
MKRECNRNDLIQERSLNEQWGVNDDGSLDIGDFRGDGGISEFSNYACENCDGVFDTWRGALEHLEAVA